MPRARWGIRAADVDNFDRETQYAPYTGKIPQNNVYQWTVKVAKFIEGTREKFAQLRVGLELVPRDRDEKQYKGYFIMCFLPVAEKTAFRYVPFLDAIGVTGRDFENRTIVDEEGKIRRIGRWNNDGSTLVLAQLADGMDQNNNARKEITWFGPLDEETEDAEESDDEYDDSDADYVDDVDEYDDVNEDDEI